jgi:hypothetical protein
MMVLPPGVLYVCQFSEKATEEIATVITKKKKKAFFMSASSSHFTAINSNEIICSLILVFTGQLISNVIRCGICVLIAKLSSPSLSASGAILSR